MSDSKNVVRHEGTILKFKDGIVNVRVIVVSACEACHVKSSCGIAEMKEKIIEVRDYRGIYKIGEKVTKIGRAHV